MGKDSRYIIIGVIAMFTGVTVSFLAVIDIIPPLPQLLFAAYGISTVGFTVGLYGVFSKIYKKRLERSQYE
ncbi:MAG: hypothetical protein QW096_10120 [Thermofilaceae archaeon]